MMKLRFSTHFLRSYTKAPVVIQRRFDRQATLLVQDLLHPSIHAKKYDESLGVWQGRVNRDWRFYFTIEGDFYHLHEIKPHPK